MLQNCKETIRYINYVAISIFSCSVSAIFKCVDAYYPNDLDTQTFIMNTELAKYTKKERNFGYSTAIKALSKNDESYDQGLLFKNFYILNLIYIQFTNQNIYIYIYSL